MASRTRTLQRYGCQVRKKLCTNTYGIRETILTYLKSGKEGWQQTNQTENWNGKYFQIKVTENAWNVCEELLEWLL